MPHRFSLFVLFLLLGSGCTGWQAVPPAAVPGTPSDYAFPTHDSLVIATWNVEHFVDAYDNPWIDNRREDDADPDRFDQQTRWLADGLRQLDADIIVLQEFEGVALAEWIADNRAADLGYEFVGGTDKATWYQNVVVLSRLPLGVVRSYSNVYTPIEGEVDESGRIATQRLTNHRVFSVAVQVRPDFELTLVGAHLKAGRGARNEGWRLGQIRFLHADLAEHGTDAVVVAGDLNLLPGSAEHTALLNADGAAGPVRFLDPLPDEARGWTHPSEAPSRRLDYVLPDTDFARRLRRMTVAYPLDQPALSELSDHLPVRAVFVME